MHTLTVHVRYPCGDNPLVLRTDADWDHDLLPVHTTAEGATFVVPCPRPSLELKPCLLAQGERQWSVGENYVLSAFDLDPEVWPSFHSPTRGTVSPLVQVEAGGRCHAVRVYTPPGYAENTLRRFPVLYLQDGRNLFFPDEAFGGQEWRVDETMDRLDQMNAARKVIVVGIAPIDRMRDYTAPGYHDYGEFVAGPLKAFIDGAYRTRTAAQDTIVGGSSLGGVVSFHMAWSHPDVFGGAMCLSSTFGYRDELFARVSAEPKKPVRLYLDSGWPRDNYAVTNAMRDLLVRRGYTLGDDLLAFSFPDGAHREGSWAERLHVPFQFFFGRAWAAARAHPQASGSISAP